MKRLYILLIVAFGLILTNSCSRESESLFKNSPSQRLENTLKKASDVLVSPENGWVMYYYPGGKELNYGGYCLTVKFNKEGNCQFQSVNNDDVALVSKSTYTLGKDDGATLNFDTYNDALHFFSNPDPSEGESMLGDYEFVFNNISQDRVVLKGKKFNSKIIMEKLTVSPTEYLKKVKENSNDYLSTIFKSPFGGIIGGKPVKGKFLNKQYLLLEQGGDAVKVPFMFTADGSQIYEPFTLNGRKVNDLKWDNEKKQFTSSDNTAVLSLEVNESALPLSELVGLYTLKYNGVSTPVVIEALNSNYAVLKTEQYSVIMKYNAEEGRLEIGSQKIKSQLTDHNLQLLLWSINGGGSLTENTTSKLVTKFNGDKSNFILDLVSNGEGWSYKGSIVEADSWLIWDENKEDPADYIHNSRVRGPIQLVKDKFNE